MFSSLFCFLLITGSSLLVLDFYGTFFTPSLCSLFWLLGSKLVKGIDLLFSRGQINRKTKKFLTPHSPRAARFYLLPKIHKPGHPSRPTVVSNSALTERISLFVDHFLKSCLVRIPSYIWDTNDFLSKLRKLRTCTPQTHIIGDLAALHNYLG